MTISETTLQVASLLGAAATLVGGITGLAYSPAHARDGGPAETVIRKRCHCDSPNCAGYRYIKYPFDDEKGAHA